MPEQPYPDVASQPSFPELERDIIEFWRADDTFQASIDRRDAGPNGSNEFVFYDGPPFANGLPHYGHLLTGFVKDAVPRYKTMQGRRVERRFGWDCHGLPAEMETEKELGVSGHVAINKFGIEKFNRACQRSVLQYTEAWERYITRAARWVDFKNDYKTLDISYMETVMWVFKQLWDKGLVYEGYKVLPYCWECETPLSNFETRLDDAYRDRQDQVVTIFFELDDGRRLLVWTTTPWTLPSNLAIAVGPDIDYAVFEEAGHQYLIGDAVAANYAEQLKDATQVGTVKGSSLVGHSYTPLFPYFADTPNAFRVLAGDFVTTEDGTGAVHMAPGFGEDDQSLCEANGIPLVVPVDQQGKFTAEVPDYAGLQVFDANKPIINDLRDRGVLVKRDTYVHSYPHCWRTNTPLIYRATGSWFVEVTRLKQRMLELNQDIQWVPSGVRDGAFGSWLKNVHDWSISRDRFWGSPIPVWQSDDPAYPRTDVYGSLDELERDFGVRPENLHRPFIDELTRPNPDDPTGKSTMRRVEQVLDCWFESGSMPYAQVHYPFDNADWFEHHFPADFIVEYVGQCKAWFYNLHVLSTALFDRPAFQTCVVHGVVLGDDGRKASKSLRNYIDPFEVFDTYGSDVMRWALLSSAILRGADLILDHKNLVDARSAALMPMWNAWSFFTLYANTDGYKATFRTDAPGLLDRYALAKASELIANVTDRMEAYDLFGACSTIADYLDALTNWYIRRSRERVWRSEPDAYDTLATVLEVTARTLAPLMPLLSEHIWRGLTGRRSVHLTDWPTVDEMPSDPELVAAMDRVREICSAAHSIRDSNRLRSRLPLAKLTIAVPGAGELDPFRELIQAELNVKAVELTDAVDDFGDRRLTVVPQVAGPRLGSDVQKVIRAVKAGDWSAEGDGTIVAAGITLLPEEFELRLVPSDPTTTRAFAADTGLVVLALELTPELEQEGLARDVSRLVNEARKLAGLRVSDRIRLVLECHDDVRDAVEAHRAMVMDQALATELSFHDRLADGHRAELPDGRAIRIGVPLAD